MSNADNPHLVIDLGSAFIKAGFAGEEGPRVIIPSLIGRPKGPGVMIGSERKDYYVGTQAAEKRGILSLKRPIEQGLISDWDDAERILSHCFTNELRVVPQEHHVLIAESPLNPKENRERLTQILFDMFRVPGFYLASTAVLALHAAGKMTGVVVNCGDGVTHVVPIFDGYALPHSILQSNLAGTDITVYLAKLLGERGPQLTTSAELEIVNNIKEKHCYVAADFSAELRAAKSGALREINHERPDGGHITVGSERFRAPEVLFNPSLIGRETEGLHQLVYSAIMKSDADLRADLFRNIVLAGGSTAFAGLPERLKEEVSRLAPPAYASKVKVFAMPDRKNSAWIGGSVLCSRSDFSPMWITPDEYREAGPRIVHRKCF